MVKEERKQYYISKWTRVHAVCQHTIRLNVKLSMLLLYYKTKLAFFNGYKVQERSIIILWEFSKTDYNIGSSVTFGQVFKRFKLKKKNKKNERLTLRLKKNKQLSVGISLSHVHIQRKKEGRIYS